MVSRIVEVLSGMGILIAIYLLLSNGEQTTSIIRQLGNTVTGSVKTLQGR